MRKVGVKIELPRNMTTSICNIFISPECLHFPIIMSYKTISINTKWVRSQMDKALDFGSKDCRFESCRTR